MPPRKKTKGTRSEPSYGSDDPEALQLSFDEPFRERPERWSDNEDSDKSKEVNFKNLKWTKIIKIGAESLERINLFYLQEDWEYFQECPPKPLKSKKR